jgi:AcrR family transcriptional regulator
VLLHSRRKGFTIAGMKAFSAKERERIAARLRDRGRELFLRHGLGPTSISELAAAAGIGSGSFYSFYASKERLLAEILLEDCSRASLAIEDAASSRGDPARVLSALLAGLVSALGDNALLRDALCGGGATGAVLAKSDKERLLRASLFCCSGLVRDWQARGIMRSGDPDAISLLLYSFVPLGTCRREIGEGTYSVAMAAFPDAIAAGLVPRKP